MSLRPIYFVHGSLWRMKVMEYDDDVELKRLLKDRFSRVMSDGLLGVVNDMQESGVLMDAFAIVLKRFEPSILFPLRWWNSWRIKRMGVKESEIIRKMSTQQIARVTFDFFRINLSWIGAYLSFADSSSLKSALIPLLKNSVYLKNPLYSLHKETSGVQKN